MNLKYAATWLMLSAVTIGGCNSGSNMFRSGASTPGTTMATPPPAAAGTPATGAPHAPYVLSAQSAGPFINFSVYNLGTTDLEVKKEDFALIATGSREVTPYDKQNTIIDLPQPATVKPNETLKGRVIFKQVQNPIGRRLVYKPDATGTFADVIAAPPADTTAAAGTSLQ